MPDARSPAPLVLQLASASPRRRELLQQLGIAPVVLEVPAPPGEDEPRLAGETPLDYVRRTARDKAQRALAWRTAEGLPRLPLLAADTCVSMDQQIFGKPQDAADARRILQALSGRCHDVRTAVVLVGLDGQLHEALSETRVWMQPLSAAQIEAYCASPEPYGKAGAYGIQGRAGAFVSRIDGSYSGVMGLPLHDTARLLVQAGLMAG